MMASIRELDIRLGDYDDRLTDYLLKLQRGIVEHHKTEVWQASLALSKVPAWCDIKRQRSSEVAGAVGITASACVYNLLAEMLTRYAYLTAKAAVNFSAADFSFSRPTAIEKAND